MDAPAAEALLTLAEDTSAKATGPDGKAALDRLETEYDDLLAALQWFIDHERTDESLRLANALYRFWITKQRFEHGAAWFERALTTPGGTDAFRGKAFINAGFMPLWMGQDDRAAGSRFPSERLLAVLPEAMGAAEFERALAVGRAMASSEAVDLALGARSTG